MTMTMTMTMTKTMTKSSGIRVSRVSCLVVKKNNQQ